MKMLKCLICLLLSMLLMVASSSVAFAANAPVIDSKQRGSITIYKYDMTKAAAAGLTSSVYVSTGKAKADAAAAFAPYAIQGVEFTILRVGSIATYDSGNGIDQQVQVVYGVEYPELLSALGISTNSKVYQKDKVDYYSSDTLVNALSKSLSNNNTSTKDKLEAIISSSSKASRLPLTDKNGKTQANDLDLGLYLAVETKVPENVTSTVDPFLISVPMTDTENLNNWFYDVTVYPKNQSGKPTLAKEVEDADHGLSYSSARNGYSDVATASDNDLLNYRIISKLPQIHSTATYLTQYEFVDTLSKGIEYNQNDVKICWYKDNAVALKDYTAAVTGKAAVNGSKADATWKYGSEFFKVDYGTADNDATTMTVKLTAKGLAEVNKPTAVTEQEGKYSGWTMVVYYDCTLHADEAVTYGDTGNPNDVTLTWSRTTDGRYDTLTDKTIVYVYGIDLTKVLSEGGDPTQVKFTLENKDNNTGSFYLQAEAKTPGRYYITGNTTDQSSATKFAPDADGRLLIYGLEEDTYEMVETDTAKGYTLLKDPIAIEVKTAYTAGDKCGSLVASATVDEDKVDMLTVNKSAHAMVPLTVLNTKDFDLPKTGGSGTMAITVAGVLLLTGILTLAALGRKRGRNS